MNEEEMMKIIKYHSCYDISEEDKKTKSWEYIDISGDEFHEFRNALIQLLDLYEQEKEKNKKLEEELNKFRKGEIFSANQAKFMEKQNKVLQNVIDMMAEDISSGDLFTWDGSSELVKEYYFKKARGEENETN